MAANLEQRLKRLMLLRLVMVTTLLLIAVTVEAVSEHLLPVNPLYFVIVATYGLSVLHAVALRFVPHLRALAYAQVLSDLLLVTALIYVAGGARTGFTLLYPISVLSGGVLLYRRGALTLAGLATLLYAGVLYLVRVGVVPPHGLSEVPFVSARGLVYSIFVMGVSCVTVALVGSYLSESLRRVGAKLEEAAEQVADLQELNQVIIDSIHSGLMTADPEGRVLYLNGFGARILGRRPAEVRGRPLHQLFGSVLLDPAALEARARVEELERLELSFERVEGERRTLGMSVSPLATAAGGYLIAFQDLTELKRLEEDLRLKDKLAAVGEMAAQLAHEIRNPLGSISGSAQVLLADEGFAGDQKELLAIITRESKRLSETLNQFLFQARPSAVPAGPVELGAVLREAVTLLRNSPEVGPAHRVEYQSDAGPHVCLAQPDRIVQVFWNLARNGLEAMPEGGVLAIRLDRAGKEVVLTVRDQGRGLSPEEHRRLFEPFGTSRPLGTGLGLAIVYRIVHEHRGDISLRNLAPRGTEVQVRLPAFQPGAPA